MGKRGPAKTPTAVLKGRGSWRAKGRADEPVAPGEKPTCPGWLPAEARREFRRVTKHLETMGILSVADRTMIAGYCLAWNEVREATEQIEDEGRVVLTAKGMVKNPWVLIRENALAQLLRFAQQFGLSPASRANVKCEGPKAAPERKVYFTAGA